MGRGEGEGSAPLRPLTPEDVGLGQLFWAIRDAVIVGDAATGRVALWNPAAEALFGYRPKEAVGMPIEALVPDGLKPAHRTGIARYAASGRGPLVDAAAPVEVPALRRDGTEIAVELSLTPIADARVPGSFVLAVIRDATERKRAEAERARLAQERSARAAAEAAARRQGAEAALLDTLLRAAPVAFAFFDRELRFALVNEAMAEINGLPATDHLGRTLGEAVPAMALSQEALIRGVLETGEPVADREVSGETLRAPGQQRHWLVSYYPVAGPGGERVGVGAVVAEITEQVALDRLRRDFLAMVTHDLRSPLTAVKTAGQLLKRRGEYRSGTVESMLAQVGRMERLIDDLVDVVRLEGGTLPLRRSTVDLVKLARAAAREAGGRAGGRVIMVEAPAEPVVGAWDGDRLAQVLQNLVGNAIRYSPQDADVTVRVEQGNGEARVTVADRGAGIAPEHHARLFERFYRAGATGSGGLGLGLYIARMLVEAHGGRIWVRSTPGTGSEFTFALPRDRGRDREKA